MTGSEEQNGRTGQEGVDGATKRGQKGHKVAAGGSLGRMDTLCLDALGRSSNTISDCASSDWSELV